MHASNLPHIKALWILADRSSLLIARGRMLTLPLQSSVWLGGSMELVGFLQALIMVGFFKKWSTTEKDLYILLLYIFWLEHIGNAKINRSYLLSWIWHVTDFKYLGMLDISYLFDHQLLSLPISKFRATDSKSWWMSMILWEKCINFGYRVEFIMQLCITTIRVFHDAHCKARQHIQILQRSESVISCHCPLVIIASAWARPCSYNHNSVRFRLDLCC